MTKRIFLKIVLILIGIFVGYAVCYFHLKPSIRSKVEKKYVFAGTETVKWKIYREYPKNKKYSAQYDPLGVYSIEGGVVNSASSAYEIAYTILTAIYGKSLIDSEKPLVIKLINNKYWEIHGSLPPNSFGGVGFICIKKDDGQIQSIKHEK